MANYSGMTLEQLLELREKKRQELERLQSAPSAAPEGPMQGPTQGPMPVEEPEPVPATETGTAPSYEGMSLEELQQKRQEKMQQLEGMGGLTFEQRVARERELSGEAFERGDYLEGLAKYAKTLGPTDLLNPRKFGQAIGFIEQDPDQAPAMSEGSLMALGDLLSNLGTQTVQAATTVGKVLSDPGKAAGEAWETAKDVAGAVKEAPWETTKAIGGGLLSEAGEIIQDPAKYAREKPLDTAMMALPSGAVRTTLAKTVPAVGRGATHLATGAAGFFSRKGKGVFDEIVEATAEGASSVRKQTLDKFRGTGIAGKLDTSKLTKELADEVLDAVSNVKSTLNEKWLAGIKIVQAGNKGKLRHTMKGVISSIDEALGNRGIDIKALREGDTWKAFEKFGSDEKVDHTAIIETLELVDKWTDNSYEGLHILKQKLAKKASFNKLLGASSGEEAIRDIWKSVRERLSKRPDGADTGYDKVAKQFEEGWNLLEDTASALSVKGNPETVARKMINMFKDPGALDVRRQFIDELEDATGKPLKAMVAGLESRSWVPQGTGAWSALLAGGGVTTAALTAPSALLILPFTSPKLMGGLGRSLGWSKKAINNAQDYVQNMGRISKTLGYSTQGASVGIMLDRLLKGARERRSSGPDLLTNLGRGAGSQYEEQSTQVMR
jgi:hypothetical protein